MIVVAGTVRVRPEKREEAIRAALAMARASAAEAGCGAYRFSAALDDPSTFFIFEEWAGEEALAAHFATAHMRAFQAAIPGLVAGGLEVWRYDGGVKSRMM